MKSKDEMHKCLDEWWGNDTTGNIIFYRSPGAKLGDAILEEVVKGREMKPEVQAAFEYIMDELKIERGEMFRNKQGEADRIKITRRYDG